MKKKGKDQKGKERSLFGQNMDRREFLKKGSSIGNCSLCPWDRYAFQSAFCTGCEVPEGFR